MEGYYENATGGCGCDGGSEAATGGGVGDTLYSGTAAVGRAYTTVGAVIACVIAIILIIIGAAKLRSPRTSEASATVTKIVQTQKTQTSGGATQYEYLLDGQFMNTSTKKVVTLTSVPYSSNTAVVSGHTLHVYYDPTNPTDAAFATVSPKSMGIGLMVGGAVLAAAGVGVAVLARKSKAFAAFEGAVGSVNTLRSLV